MKNTEDLKRLITLSKRFKTNEEGIFYKKVIYEKDKDKNIDSIKEVDKVFIIRYRENDKDKLVTIGKYSQGIRLAYCKEKRNEILNKIRLGESIPVKHKKAAKTYYDDLAHNYFIDKKVKKERIAKYDTYIYPIFGKDDIDSITKQKVIKFLNDIEAQGKAPQTVNGIRELLSAIINHNIKNRDLKYINPCVGVPRLKVDNDRERYLSLEEIKQLREELKENFVLNLFIDLSLQTGGRIETILHIQKKDINLASGTITLKNLKTNSTYTGYLKDSFIEDLKDYLRKLKVNDYVVCTDGNHSIKTTHRQIQWRLKPILDKLFNQDLDIKDTKNRVVIHTLRHTFASHLAINGTPIFTIQKLMDHKKIEQTLRYAKLSPENGKNAIQNLYIY